MNKKICLFHCLSSNYIIPEFLSPIDAIAIAEVAIASEKNNVVSPTRVSAAPVTLPSACAVPTCCATVGSKLVKYVNLMFHIIARVQTVYPSTLEALVSR